MCKFSNVKEINDLKTYIMRSYRYCVKVYETIEDESHFETWFNLCNAHVNSCNFLLKKTKPLITFINTKYVKAYKEFKSICEYTVGAIQATIDEYLIEKNKANEELEMYRQLEAKARMEYELAMEYKEAELQNQKEIQQQNPIGFSNKTVNEDDNQQEIID